MLQTYRYKAKNVQGEVLAGYIQAADPETAVKILRRSSLLPLEVNLPKSLSDYLHFSKRISIKDRAVLARQLATMINAGLPLVQAINIILKQTTNKRLRTVLASIYSDIEGGFAFSTALSKFPDVFSRIFVNVVRAGEATGKLEVVLLELADNLEKSFRLTGKIKGALFYPAFILMAMIGVAILMMVKVIPTLTQIFEEAGAELPITTRILIATSNFLINRWYVVIIVVAFLIVSMKIFTSSPKGVRFFSRLQIVLPLIKTMSQESIMAHFARTLGMLIGSGVPVLESIRIVADSVNNIIYRDDIKAIAYEVERGVPMSVPVSKNPIFPILVGQMLAVGEQTGKMAEILEKLAHYYEDETEERVKGISSLLEPAIMILVGIGVAILVFSILVPIYKISSLEN